MEKLFHCSTVPTRRDASPWRSSTEAGRAATKGRHIQGVGFFRPLSSISEGLTEASVGTEARVLRIDRKLVAELPGERVHARIRAANPEMGQKFRLFRKTRAAASLRGGIHPALVGHQTDPAAAQRQTHEPSSSAGSVRAAPDPWNRSSALADWPIPWRERWGRRADALQDAGLGWKEAEQQAFKEVAAERAAATQRGQ
jgi:hypothetical protein